MATTMTFGFASVPACLGVSAFWRDRVNAARAGYAGVAAAAFAATAAADKPAAFARIPFSTSAPPV